MKQTITIIYFTDNAGKARTVEFSLKSLVLLIIGLFILILVLITSAAFSLKLYVEKSRLLNELASVAAEKNSLQGRVADTEAQAGKIDPIAVPSVKTKTAEIIEPASLNGFQVKKDGGKVVVSFDLVKANNTGESLQGYIFMVGDYGGIYFSFPEGIEIEDGSPVDFKKGDRFSIKWQKHMEQIFPLSMDSVLKAVNVFVFSADGELLIKKEAGL
ncbi:MAG: hypothetical protein AABY52_07540 [Deltaproteobacteria bacterium]